MKKGLSGTIKWGFLLALVTLVSCQKDKRTELFEINHYVDFDIQPGLNTFDTHIISISPIASLYQEKLTDSGKAPQDVIAIEAKDAYLASIFKDENLKFIDQVTVHIFDPFHPPDKVEFFYLDPVPYKNTTSIRLFPGIADISHWVDQEFFGIEVRLHFREVTPSLIHMRLEFDMRAMGN